jgi:hypothetical protein
MSLFGEKSRAERLAELEAAAKAAEDAAAEAREERALRDRIAKANAEVARARGPELKSGVRAFVDGAMDVFDGLGEGLGYGDKKRRRRGR